MILRNLAITRTNPEAFRGRGIFRIIADEGFALYRGWGWTAARNAPGSFAVSAIPLPVARSGALTVVDTQLFGGSAFTKEYILGLKDYSSATWGQNAIASVMGSVASITISQPLDVIKVRCVCTDHIWPSVNWIFALPHDRPVSKTKSESAAKQSITEHALIQRFHSFESKVGGLTLMKDLIKHEGVCKSGINVARANDR